MPLKQTERKGALKAAVMARFELKIPQTLLDAVEDWAARQPSKPNKSEAVRRLIEMALAQANNPAP
jgi:metal-responsive CopG/Arc/MetJ family transcriptional regulator